MRADRRTARAGTVLVALVLAAGCGIGGEPGASTAPVGGDAPTPTQEAVSAEGRYVPDAPSPTALPDALVGSWSGDDPQGVGSWTIEFAPDGGYREGNTRRGVAITGRAAVAGRRLFLQPDAADSRTVTWQAAGGTLSLDGFTYRRAGSYEPSGPSGSGVPT
jgi:hypothetical protein